MEVLKTALNSEWWSQIWHLSRSCMYSEMTKCGNYLRLLRPIRVIHMQVDWRLKSFSFFNPRKSQQNGKTCLHPLNFAQLCWILIVFNLYIHVCPRQQAHKATHHQIYILYIFFIGFAHFGYENSLISA